MKRTFCIALAALCLVGCTAKADITPATPESAGSTSEAVQFQVESTPEPDTTPTPRPEPSPISAAEIKRSEEKEPTNRDIVPTPTPTPAPAAAAKSDAEQVQADAADVSMSYGAVPFDLAAGTGEWWQIDSSDSAYWAVAENINALRASVGLSALSVDGNLSAAAGSRCESFVAGGPFDHSGMTTRSEICAVGPIGSASAVCSYWQGSPAHYANIMEPGFTSMGVGCWFCSVDGDNYTYWCVTFA